MQSHHKIRLTFHVFKEKKNRLIDMENMNKTIAYHFSFIQFIHSIHTPKETKNLS